MPISPVRRGAANEIPACDQPEIPHPRPVPERAEATATGLPLCRRARPLAGRAAIGARPRSSGWSRISQRGGATRRGERCPPDQHHRTPAGIGDQGCVRRKEDQLAGGIGRGQEADNHPLPRLEPARGDVSCQISADKTGGRAQPLGPTARRAAKDCTSAGSARRRRPPPPKTRPLCGAHRSDPWPPRRRARPAVNSRLTPTAKDIVARDQ